MKRTDFVVIAVMAGLIAVAANTPDLLPTYQAYTAEHGYILSFIKFAILATFGECVALRIVAGRYWRPGFGLLAKAVMWGFLGLFIKAGFTIFATGSPFLLGSMGLDIAADGGFTDRLIIAFTTSVTLNTVFAPVLMVAHKVYDDHIDLHGGSLKSIIIPVNIRERMAAIDWSIMWGLVLKKTIPFFWIPAHTITFMLPPNMRIVFAAILGGVLGIILAFASLAGGSSTKNEDIG